MNITKKKNHKKRRKTSLDNAFVFFILRLFYKKGPFCKFNNTFTFKDINKILLVKNIEKTEKPLDKSHIFFVFKGNEVILLCQKNIQINLFLINLIMSNKSLKKYNFALNNKLCYSVLLIALSFF